MNGCVNTNTKTVTVNPLPAAPTVSDKEYCFNETAVALTATNLANHILGWYGTDATGGTIASSAPIPLTTTVGSSTYYVSQTNIVTSCESSRAAIIINVKALPPAPAITSNSPVCEGDNLTLNTTNISGAIYYWEGVNNFTSSNSNPSINNVTSAMAGNYSLKIKFNGCVSPVSSPVVVVINPIPAVPIVSSNSPVEEGHTLNLIAQDVIGGSFNWSGPNAYTSTDQNPVLPFSTIAMSGIYSVKVKVGSCISLPSLLTIVINSQSKFQIPNAFVPGSTNEYDNKFRIFANSAFPPNLLLSFRIFNRNGQLIKTFVGINDSWDGRGPDGNLLESDVYLWAASFTSDPLTTNLPTTGTFILLK